MPARSSRGYAAMFVDEGRRDHGHGCEIDRSQTSAEAEKDERRQASQDASHCARRRLCSIPRLDDERMQSFRAIELEVLRRVNQVETRYPADDAGAEQNRRQAKLAVCAIQAPTGATASASPRMKWVAAVKRLANE